MRIGDRTLTYCAATIGNPHCVILDEPVLPETAKALGPLIESAPIFPNRINVQFLEVIDNTRIKIEIWERGAGYTLASGSSSTAAAAVACRLGLCGNNLDVQMPGGTLHLSFTADFAATMIGSVVAVCDGEIRDSFFEKSDLR
jgi:diaminopimelate epimerase